MKNNTNIKEDTINNDTINLRDIIKKGTYHWQFFIISIFLALVLAFVYLKFATYKYEVSSTILINDEDNDGGSTSEITVFQDLGLFAGPKTSLDTEIGVLKSKSLIERVIKDLSLNVTYFEKNQITQNEVYKNQIPFKINFALNEKGLTQLNTFFTIKSISETKYNLLDSEGTKIITGVFGENLSWDYGEIVVTPIAIDDIKQKEILFKISPLEEVAIAYKRGIEIIQDNPKSNLLILTLQDPIKLKAAEILDSLVSYYNQEAIDYKNLIADNTNEFLNNRITDVAKELKIWDQGVETYRVENKLSNIEYESNITLASNASVAKQIGELNSQIKLADYLVDYMKTNKDDIIPGNLGLLNDNVNQNIINYNNLLLERNRLLQGGANSQNPIVLEKSGQIKSLRESIDRGLVNQRSSLSISLNEARRQENKLDSQIFSTPKKERNLKVIQRQQDIMETLYLYLLQKREENSISSAVTAPYALVIDEAYGTSVPVAPRKIIVLISSLLLGFLIPALVLMFRAIFNNKIHRYEDVEKIIDAPLIGDIPKTKLNKGIIPFKDKKSARIAESFRLMRTNIIYALAHKDINNKTIFITSTTCEEGKTFIASNLAASFALLNKNVLFLETNIQNPKIANYLNFKSAKGLSDFILDDTIKVEEIIKPNEKYNFDIIEAGSKVAGSSELLSHSRFEEILNHGALHYDYIIVDSPAVNENSDTLMLANHADMFLYVIRANALTEKMLNVPKTLFENDRLPKMNIVMTDTDYNKLGYDYGNANINKSLWKKIFR